MTARKSTTARKSAPRKRTAKKAAPKGQTTTTRTHRPGPVEAPNTQPPSDVANNQLSKSPGPSDLVAAVLRGEWGTGQDRRARLAAAGHNHRQVQAEIVRLRNS